MLVKWVQWDLLSDERYLVRTPHPFLHFGFRLHSLREPAPRKDTVPPQQCSHVLKMTDCPIVSYPCMTTLL